MQQSAGFLPPGPGVWERESTHSQRPVSRVMEALFPTAATNGFRSSMARYGLLLETIEFQIVDRFMYLCPRGVGAPKGAKGPPPKLIFQLLTKIHPEIRKRIRTISETFATKRWREDVVRWDNELKPAIARENGELQGADMRAMTDQQLVEHLGRCFDAAQRGAYTHHSLNATAMLPLGDFLAHVQQWTGMAPAQVLPLFRGASRVSLGAANELRSLVRALIDHNVLLDGTDSAAILNELTSRNDALGEAARAYVAKVGVRVATGYDVGDLTLAEMPDLLVETIRAAMSASDRSEGTSQMAELEASIRDRVPASHRDMYDELLAEARLTYRMRDERAYLNDAWSTGIARHAMLEAGRRLVAKGRLHDERHAVELTPSQVISLLTGGPGPSADDAAADFDYRATHTIYDAPAFLGGTPAGPPPAEWLPADSARSERAIGIVMGEMFSARENQQVSATLVNGFAASHGQTVGIARLVLDPRDMSRVRQGDVLITRATAPSFNALLPLLSGIVTDRGGTLSHAAVVAREYGIPAVVGTGNATELIRDGMRVRIDGASGTVEILA